MASSAKKKITKSPRRRNGLRELQDQIATLMVDKEDLGREVEELTAVRVGLRAEIEACERQLEEHDLTIRTQTEQLHTQEMELRQLRKLFGSISDAGNLTAEKLEESEAESEARGGDILMLVRLLNTRTSGRSDSDSRRDKLNSALAGAFADLAMVSPW